MHLGMQCTAGLGGKQQRRYSDTCTRHACASPDDTVHHPFTSLDAFKAIELQLPVLHTTQNIWGGQQIRCQRPVQQLQTTPTLAIKTETAHDQLLQEYSAADALRL